jgi:hypothetical protein
LSINDSFDDFIQIQFTNFLGVSFDSILSLYQKQIDEYEALHSVLNEKKYLMHKLYVEQKITNLENQKKYEIKQEFFNDD